MRPGRPVKYRQIKETIQTMINDGRLTGMVPGVHQLAKELNVNFLTVTRALDELAQENVISRISSRGTFVRQTNRLGLFIPNIPSRVLRLPVYADVLEGIEQEAARWGKAIVLLSNLPQKERLLQEVDGLILFAHGKVPDDLSSVAVPAVRIMGAIDLGNQTLDHVSYNNAAIGGLAASFLQANGHTSVAYVGPAGESGIFKERQTTFCNALKQQGFSVTSLTNDYVVDQVRLNQALITADLRDLLEGKNRPTAIFTPADMLACGVYSALGELGRSPGRDVEVVSCNNEYALLLGLHPRPASIDIHAQEIGIRAVARLLHRIRNPQEPAEKILLQPKLILP